MSIAEFSLTSHETLRKSNARCKYSQARKLRIPAAPPGLNKRLMPCSRSRRMPPSAHLRALAPFVKCHILPPTLIFPIWRRVFQVLISSLTLYFFLGKLTEDPFALFRENTTPRIISYVSLFSLHNWIINSKHSGSISSVFPAPSHSSYVKHQ